MDIQQKEQQKDAQQTNKDVRSQQASSDGSNWANGSYDRPKVIEERPDELDCDVVRFQNNKDKWVAFVGLLDCHQGQDHPTDKFRRKPSLRLPV